MSVHEISGRPLRKDAELNRQRVLSAARELFAVKGLEATLNDVAHYARLGVGTVYRRFPTKEALFEAIFEEGINELAALAESSLEEDDSWHGFTGFVEQMCEVTATDRGMREIVFGAAYGGDRVEAARIRLMPPLSKLVERAKNDGHLRPEASDTDVPIFALLAGTVSGYAGAVDADLWRRYVALLIEGMRSKGKQTPLTVDALENEELETLMRTWQPAGPF